ncbi:MAG: TetR/AcrR family transcriptional regulator [Ferruginibacter sp.]|nr:TetR/AcrR family transcriptional regulator [Ferruginibacter sp.]
MQYGLRSVSMDDIANNLGISKKTIYQYFADKDELVNAVVGSIIQHNQQICDFDRSEAKDAIHEIFLAMDLVVAMFRSMNPSLLFDMQKYYPGAFAKFAQHKNDYIYGIIRDNITRGIREELYRPEIRVDVMARFRVESIIIPFNPEFHTKVKEGLADIEEELTYHFLYGLISPKGYKLTQKYQQERIQKLQANA